jgi:hypothetical protein
MARLSLFRPRVGYGLSVTFAVLLLLLLGDRRHDLRAQTGDPCATVPVNPIACENSKPGNPASEWDISGAGSGSIEGFATDISVNKGQTVNFKVNTTAASYRIDIYRLGYYAGNGARLQAQILTPTATVQPACLTNATTGLIDCGNWSQSASWAVPSTAVSGVYIARLVAGSATNHMVFIVRDDTGNSDLLFQTSDTTWQAYNRWGGNSLYVGAPANRAYKVSYNRPFTTRGYAPEDWLFNAEYPMIRWLEANGYNVSYFTGVDSDRIGGEILDHKIFLSVGHDEYWSGQQRTNVEAARAAGVDLAFFSGNEVFWKTRWENSIDGTNTTYRTLVSYKETHANAKIDPLSGVWTGTWRDPRFSPPDDGGRPENALTGTLFTVNCCSFAIQVPEPFGKMRLWRNTSVATLASGQTATLSANTLGYEWDEDIDNGFRPAGLVRLSSTTQTVTERILDYGSTYGPGSATHSLTMYRHASGALVFGAGTIQWSWGLDGTHDRGGSTADVRMRQATVNLFADMGVQPSTLQSGLVAASASADITPPTTAITAPTAGAQLGTNTPVLISGTASDAAGGTVAAVEVSVDGGATWKPATGRSAWTYSWTTPTSAATVSIRSRAIDDSGNIQTAVTSVSVTVGGTATAPVPVLAFNFNEGAGTTVADVSGANNNGTVSNTAWTTAGKNGNALTFNGSNSWVTVPDANSLDLTSAMTLEAWIRPTVATGWRTVVMKETTGGLIYALYGGDDAGRPSEWLRVGTEQGVSGPTALAANTWTHVAATFDGTTMRVYVNGAQVATRAWTNTIATSTGVLRIGGNSIWGEYFNGQIDDVRIYNRVLTAAEITTDMNTPVAPPDKTAPIVSSVSPTPNTFTGNPFGGVKAVFNEAIDPATVNSTTFELRDASSNLVPGGVSYDAATFTATFMPTTPLPFSAAYSASVRGGTVEPRVKDTSGNALAATFSWQFTTATRGVFCPCTMFEPTQTPTVVDVNDAQAIEIGMKFTSERSGYVSAVRFYKAAANTGTHTGKLWDAAGTLLGTATFAAESATGWQQASFPTPIPITANATYTVSYWAPLGHYSGDVNFFTNGYDYAPLHAIANTASPNGVYNYGSSSLPFNSFNATNYWVDLVYIDTIPLDTPPIVLSTTPLGGATGVSTTAPITATFNEAMTASTINSTTFELRQGAALITATVSYNPANTTATLQTTAPLTPNTQYTATIRGGAVDPRVKDAVNTPMAANVTWTFTTAAIPANEGPGGPILVIGSTGNVFGRYFGEILRNEGMNAFTVTDISLVTATMLNSYDVVILGEMPLTAAQVTMFTTWVTAGGNLIANKPDKQLASLLGLTDAASTLANGYLLVSQTGPGAGIVNQTIQFHGTADRYTLNGATSLATLYSSATTATTNPAVTLRSVGTAGGQAAAFTFDLARSVVYTRQGNPAWAGQERDGTSPIRSDDMFFGNGSADWIDLNKVQIPQADEQQRLLANMILSMNADRKPLPRFWYLPRMGKAAVVMTGDDHSNNGTQGRFDALIAASTPGCNVANWECIRMTSYIYPSTPLSNAQAVTYNSQGFEVALHVTTDCQNYTEGSFGSFITSQLSTFASKYTGIPAPTTNRTHCIAFSDWSSQPKIEKIKNVRFDTNYYYWPGSWLQDRPGHFTGSGLPMRFADLDGTTIDVYQANTQMPDESNMTYSTHINTLLDNALGASGFYAVVTANMHTDTAAHAGSDTIIASAKARNVPVVSAVQMLNWLDGRNGSSFGSIALSGGTLTFTIAQGTGATGLYAMLPRTATAGPLASLTRGGTAVAFTVQTIKGVDYAVFPATAGSYSALYSNLPDTTITANPPASTTSTSASFSFTASPAAGATFQCSLDGAAYATCVSPVNYTGLSVASHTFNVRSVNATGTDPSPATWTWAVTMTVPDTTITSPAPSTTSTSASFTFTATPAAGATFQCSLDGAAYAACTSPANYTGLTFAAHTFNVRAVNAGGTDPTPATVSWTIILAVPDTTITSSPTATTTSTSATFAFTSTAGGTFECSRDGAAFAACTSPITYTALVLGAHTFSVRATNAAGTDPSPATFNWTISNSIPGLVLALGFEENTGTATADSSTSGNNGTLSGATWSTAGRFGNAVSFNGTSSMVNVPDSASLDLTTAMTLEAWVRPTAVTDWRTVILKETGGGLIYSLYASDGSRPNSWIRIGSNEVNANGSGLLAVNTWTHLAVTYDGATLRLYVNGTQVGTRAIGGTLATSTGVLRIGGNSVWGEFFSGLIDEVRVYNRVLTAAEIGTDMNAPIKP